MVVPGRSLKWQLSALCLGLLVPTLAFVGVLLWQYAASERSRVEEQARFLSRSLATALDREINGVLTTLQALATSPSLQTHDLAAFYAQASEIRRLQGIHISLRSVDGTTVLTTRAPLGAAVPVPPLLAETDRDILRVGKATVSDVFASATSGLPVFQVVAAPIVVGGVRTYLLAASIDLDFLSNALRREDMPQGWIGAVVDRNGVFAIRTEQEAVFAGRNSSADFHAHIVGEHGSYYGHNTAGEPILAGYAKSSLTGWVASANVGADIVDAARRRSVLLLVGLGMALVLIAALIAFVVGRRVDQAMQHLGTAAEAIGQGSAVQPLSTPIIEVNQVGLALAAASRQLQDRAHGRAAAEASLREREERLRLVVEGARDHAIFTTDPNGAITSWSAGAEAIFGWTAAEAVGQPAGLTLAPEDRAAGADAAVLAAAAREGSARDERWHVCKAGHRAFMNGSVHRLDPDATGRDRGFLIIARDETERRRADQALRELNETLETQVAERTRERDRAWRNSRDLQVVMDGSGTVLAVSPAITAILGWAAEEVTGQRLTNLIHPNDDASAAMAAFAQSAAGGSPEFEGRYRHKDGSFRWLSWVAGAEADRVYASGRDVGAQKEQEAALQQSEAALRQAQKMEAVGQLTGGIAHDFNNLLAGIIGSLDLMQSRIAQGRWDAIERYAKAAMHSAQRAAALTHRLLAFSRRQPLDPRPVQANALVASMEDLLRRTIGPLHPLEVVMAGGLWTTLCDPHQLENAILNLAINARDAMPHGGKVTVEACNASLDDAYVAQQRDVKQGQYVCIGVSDTGSGMTAEVIARAFEPFFTTKPLGQGTGLGLSMVYGFAKQSEGHLKIYSEVGRGTTVKLYLPRHRGDAVAEQAATGAPVPAPSAGNGKTILVVEDEPAIRALIVDVLNDLGYRTLEAGDGQAGLGLLQSRERIDLVVTDVGLPGLNGRQLVDQAREGRPHLKALFITGYAENATLAHGFLEPGMEMITKPFAVTALTNKISRMIEAG